MINLHSARQLQLLTIIVLSAQFLSDVIHNGFVNNYNIFMLLLLSLSAMDV